MYILKYVRNTMHIVFLYFCPALKSMGSFLSGDDFLLTMRSQCEENGAMKKESKRIERKKNAIDCMNKHMLQPLIYQRHRKIPKILVNDKESTDIALQNRKRTYPEKKNNSNTDWLRFIFHANGKSVFELKIKLNNDMHTYTYTSSDGGRLPKWTRLAEKERIPFLNDERFCRNIQSYANDASSQIR